ncbi:MAG TPA: hypothetical protein VE995_05590 [Gaiellaceae bacterium]|nr:hypothetical protein [Gaiellaceae bacterium]
MLVVAVAGATLVFAGAAAADKPEIDTVYANGQTYSMIGPHFVPGAAQSMPNAYAHAEELYVLAYPQSALPLLALSGTVPQCDPCFELPLPFVYHDHVLTGSPGLGTAGTAGVYEGPWKIIVLMYNPAFLTASFTPITTASGIDRAEAAGEFLPINASLQHGSNPYEIDTGNLLICPLVSSHA